MSLETAVVSYPTLYDGRRDWCATSAHNVGKPCSCKYQEDESGNSEYNKAPTGYKQKPQTNYDRLIRKSPEEMADFLWSIGSNAGGWIYIDGKPLFHTGKGNGWIDWLKEATDEPH